MADIRRFIAAIFALNLFLSGCESVDMDLPPISWQGKNIVFGTTEPFPPCLGTLVALDNAVDELNRQLNMALPPGKKVHLYWMHNQMSKTPCHDDMAGCASVIEGEMYAFVDRLDAAEHEMTHLLMWPFGVGHKIFVEGIAECYGGLLHDDPVSWEHTRENVEALLATEMNDTVEYRRAGVFVCYLVNEFGIEKIKETAFASRPDWKWDDFNRVFKEVLGVSFDDVVDRFAADSNGCYVVPLTCEYPKSTVTDSDDWKQDIFIDCANETTEGSTGYALTADDLRSAEDYTVIDSRRLIDIEIPGYYRICVTDEDYSVCDPEPLLIGSPEPSEAAQKKYNIEDRYYATDLSIELAIAQCSAGPGCPWPYAMPIPLGFDHVVFLEQGTFELTLGYLSEDPLLIERIEKISVEIQPCVANGQTFAEECQSTKNLTCNEEKCRVCDTLIHDDPIMEPPDTGTAEAAACFLCRCLP